LAKNLAMVVFLAFVIVVVLRHLFTANRVTIDTIAASGCVYLMLAVFWAEIYVLIDAWIPHSFAVHADPVAGVAATGVLGKGIFTSLYFSLVTMTTLGYGDIVPLTAPAQSLASLQAVVGQLYLTVLVARLVGLHIMSGAGRKEAEPPH
jgi:voltage-gated potassium channel